MSTLVPFDRIAYFTSDPQGDFPVRRTRPTWYEGHAAMDDSQGRTGVAGDMTADSDSWSRWLHRPRPR